jgi:hypothetical protein
MTGYWISFSAVLFSVPVLSTSIIGLVLIILALIMLIYYTVMIIYMFLKTFINIMFSIILAPLQILAGTVISGSGFGSWLRRMLGNLLIYPVVGFMLFFACYLLRQAMTGGLNGNGTGDWQFTFSPSVGQFTNIWRSPFLGVQTGGLFSTKILFLAISFVIISMIPQAAELIKSIMQGKEFGASGIGRAADKVTGYGKSLGGAAESIVRTPGLLDTTKPTGAAVSGAAKILQFLAYIPK